MFLIFDQNFKSIFSIDYVNRFAKNFNRKKKSISKIKKRDDKNKNFTISSINLSNNAFMFEQFFRHDNAFDEILRLIRTINFKIELRTFYNLFNRSKKIKK